MINLLPPIEKEKLFLEKKKRMVIILWFLVLFFVICLILILFSIKIYLQSQVKTQKTLLSQAQTESNRTEINEFREKVHLINSKLNQLDSFYQNKIYFSDILERISQTLSSDAYLNNLSLEKGTENKIKVIVSGFSPTREILFEFKKNLEKEPGITGVSFPSANWVKATNIDFFVTFEISQKI